LQALVTTLGLRGADEVGFILPHEHIFVDLGPRELESYRLAEPEVVVKVMAPYLEEIKQRGVTVFVEATPVGVGRRADIDHAVSVATGVPVVVPTGIYREPWVPEWAKRASEVQLAKWMIGELTEGIEDSPVRAGWIKVSAGDDGMTAVERKILRSAAHAGKQTGAIIGSHTIRGNVVRDQLETIQDVGYLPHRFIWIHTQAEPEFDLHLEMAHAGCWLEYDAIGSSGFSDELFIKWILRLLDAGYSGQLLLSQDRGWYDPSKPLGGSVKPFTYLTDRFLPKLLDAGVDPATVQQLTVENPFRAYAREV
jgi:phosphotriesterase-related protein